MKKAAATWGNNALRVVTMLIVVVAFSLFIPLSALAQTPPDTGLGVEGALAQYDVTPGQVVTHEMTISLGAKAAPTDIQVEVEGLGQAPDGATVALSAKDDTSPLSARTFIKSIDKTAFHLEPGQSQAVKATIEIPSDAAPATRYADIYIHTSAGPSSTTGVGMILAAHVPVILKSVGFAPQETGSITKLEVTKVTAGRPIVVSGVFQNTGSSHFKVDGAMTMLDAAGKPVGTVAVPFNGSSILPGLSREFSASFSLLDKLQGLPAGTYQMEWKASLPGGGKVLDAKRVSFELTAPYQPFPGVDEESLVVANFNDEEPRTVDAKQKADMDISFTGTGKVTGTVVVAKLKQEPDGASKFSADASGGGTGKSPIKFGGIGVSGFSRGMAQVTMYYHEGELGKVDPNSIFLAYRTNAGWIKLDKQQVFTGAGSIRGEIPVDALNLNPVIALGGGGAAASSGSTPGLMDLLAANWPVAGGVLLLVAVGPTAYLVVSRRRSEEEWIDEGDDADEEGTKSR